MNTETYHQTRGDLSPAELQQYSGKWVAFSADGTRIIAAAGSLAELDKLPHTLRECGLTAARFEHAQSLLAPDQFSQ